jgi:hypothetical protein
MIDIRLALAIDCRTEAVTLRFVSNRIGDTLNAGADLCHRSGKLLESTAAK